MIKNLSFLFILEKNFINFFLLLKVMTITDVILICIKENTVEFFEQLLNLLIKSADRSIIFASRQIVDTLVDNVITLDSKLASGNINIFAFFFFVD